MNRVEQLYREHPEPRAFAEAYLAYVRKVLAGIDARSMAAFARALLDARERRSRIFFIGNGGSAATAGHFANDIAIGCRSWEKPFRAISLVDNSAVLTALANDYGYDEVFTRQLQSQMVAGDVVVAISASGNSPNILRAIEYANGNDAVTVGITGFEGGSLKELAQISVHVPTGVGEYGPAEDAHMVIDHLLHAYLTQACAAEATLGAAAR
jgi:D-sedoheptulose 7-phosphate isomerase